MKSSGRVFLVPGTAAAKALRRDLSCRTAVSSEVRPEGW